MNPARRGERRPPAAGGFTLLEVLIALIVLTLIMGAVYGSYRAVTSSITDLEPRVALDQKGRFFIQRLSRQIRCCYGGRHDQTNQSVPDQNDVKEASQEEIRYLQGGRTLSDGATLQFVTTSSTLNRGSDADYLAVVSYKMDPLQHVILTREEIYGRHSVNEDDEDWRVILGDVVEAELEYFDGTDWRDEWDSNVAGSLPKALRIKLVLESRQDGISASFSSVAAVRCWMPKEVKTQTQRTVGAGKDRPSGGKAGTRAR